MKTCFEVEMEMTWFEEIFEEYKIKFYPTDPSIS
ncbi:Uncharacterised protein [Streptococcus pneumoniae]|nr:Uncharacterised protein [Streptococcus pneumoniae]